DRYSAQYESPIEKLEQESLLAQERKIWLDKALQAFDTYAKGEGLNQNKKHSAQASYYSSRLVKTDTERFYIKNQYTKCLGEFQPKVNREEYEEVVLNCFRQKRDQTEKDLNSRTDGIGSYLEYLVKAFGGKNIKIEDNKKAPDVDPSNAQYFSGDNAIISRGKTTYEQYLRILNNIAFEKSREQAKKIGDLFSSNQLGFIPIQLGLELQGISGIKIYNKLEINQNFLPSNYPESLQFIITAVNHQLTNGEWTTALDTLSIPKNYFKGKLEPPNFTYELEADGAQFVNGFKSSLPPLLRDAIQPYDEKIFTKMIGNNRLELVSIPDLNNDANWGLKNFNSAVRDNFQSFLQDLVRDERYKGWIFYVRSTYRSFEEQYNLHKNKPDQGEAVSAGNSYHNYGAAIDLLATQPTVSGDYNHLGWTKNPTVAIPRGGLYTDENNPQSLKDLTNPYVLVKNARPGQWIASGIVEKAKEYGIAWGGNIEGIVDYNHFYIPFDKATARARGIEQYGSDEKINGLEIKIDDLLY
ncbi:MAG: M15 family metallopeptidase, partial [Fusobacterium sp.]